MDGTKCNVETENAIVLVDFQNCTSQFGWLNLYLEPIETGNKRSIYVYYPEIYFSRISKTYGKHTIVNHQMKVQGFPMVCQSF